jgi:hypothetical protein
MAHAVIVAADDSLPPASGTLEEARWPDLELSRWEETRSTLHLWSQIIGKVRLALEPMANHWWQVPFYLTARGFTTSLMHAGNWGLEIEFDLFDDALLFRRSDGQIVVMSLEPRTVADFYRTVVDTLDTLDVSVTFMPRPVEMAVAIPFAEDTQHFEYEPDAARRYWTALVCAHRVMVQFRAEYLGKASPVHLFWGSNDLAVTRFSGRTAPPHPGGAPNVSARVERLAYSHECSSCGFWPGGSAEGSFYSYAYPQPAGFPDWPIEPAGAYFDHELGEFILPYREVRHSADPEALLLQFFQSTYEAAADLAGWDRRSLEFIP